MSDACPRCWLIFLPVLLSVLLMGCGMKQGKRFIEDRREAEIQIATDSENDSTSYENTYWVAVKYADYSYDGQEKKEITWKDMPVVAEGTQKAWWMDLFLFADGTVRLRDVSGDFYDGMALEGHWIMSEDGIACTDGHWPGKEPGTSALKPEKLPSFRLVDGSVPEEKGLEGMLALDYYYGCVYFMQAPMPDKDKQLCMADMKGSWTMVSGKVDGFVYGVEEGILTSLTFEEGNYLTEAVHTSLAKCVGEISEIRASVFYREEPMYEGCGNESWSVELRPQSLFEGDDAYYATLLDEDTLLLQHFYTIDGISYVNYETYLRGSGAKDALTLQKKLQTVLAEHPATTMFCVGTDLYLPSDPGVNNLMEVVRLTEEDNFDTMMLLCPEYVKLQVCFNGDVIHETELGPGRTELLLLQIPQENGTCQFTFTSDLENWYSLDISRETFHTPKWISVLDPGKVNHINE